jgi:hypothetical protein
MPHFSLKDHILTITKALDTELGVIPAGAPFRIKSATKLSFDDGGDADHLPGGVMLPLAIVRKMAKPKVEIDCSEGVELSRARVAVGGIGSDVLLSLTMARTGQIPRSFLWPGVWKSGGGIELDEGKGFAPNKLVILATDCLEDLVSIYNQLA